MGQVEIRHGSRTDVGRVRDVNEDALLVAPPVFVVADGMGGHANGDVASRIVVEEFTALAEKGYDPAQGEEAIRASLARCQQRIGEYAEGHASAGRPRSRPGTTAVVALLVERESEPAWLVGNLGDSRCYAFANGQLEQVSVDHSLVQELVDAGDLTASEAASHPERHVITRALGGGERPEPDFFPLSLQAAPRLLLCTDGINGMIDAETIGRVLHECVDPQDAADRLVEEALSAGGRDNATAVVVDVVGRADSPQ